MKEEIKQTIQKLRLTDRLKEVQMTLQKLKDSLQQMREKSMRNPDNNNQ